jgi:LAGLIDADG DNA endonuclease family
MIPPRDPQQTASPSRPIGFMGSVNVLTESGSLEISRIVKKCLPIPVACSDPETGRIDYRPVTDWTCRRGDPLDLVLLETFARVGQRAQRGGRRAIRLARGQPVTTPDGPRRAGDLRPGDVVYNLGTFLEPWQEQVVLGSFLGDGYAGGRGPGHYGGLAICHGEDQRGYLDWKFALLANLGAKAPSTQKLSPGGFARRPTSRFTTRMHPRVSALAGEFYGGGVKRPPEGVVARAGWPGVGIWFGDDGGCVCSKATGRISTFRFHTNAFAPEEVDRLAEELGQLSGLHWRRYLQNGIYPILTLGNGDGTQNNRGQGNLARWSELIRPHVPPMLGYKLRVDSCGEAWSGLEPPEGEWPEETTIKATRPYVLASHEDCLLYHLGVAGAGNFVAHGILVGDLHADREGV